MNRVYFEKDRYGNEREKVDIENTSFIFRTNFAGDPNAEGNRFHSTERKGTLIIPEDFAEDLRAIGVNVRQTNWEEPEFYVTVKVNYGYWKSPAVYLVTDKGAKLLTEETIATLDSANIANVCVKCSTRAHDMGKTLYVDTMYVELALDNDPWYDKYHVEEDEMPFN